MPPGPRGYQKRGGGAKKVSLDEALLVSGEPRQDLVALDDALNALATFDLRKSQVVEMRFFGGHSVEETAEALRVSADTVMRDWRLAKVWLVRELSGEQPNPDTRRPVASTAVSPPQTQDRADAG